MSNFYGITHMYILNDEIFIRSYIAIDREINLGAIFDRLDFRYSNSTNTAVCYETDDNREERLDVISSNGEL